MIKKQIRLDYDFDSGNSPLCKHHSIGWEDEYGPIPLESFNFSKTLTDKLINSKKLFSDNYYAVLGHMQSYSKYTPEEFEKARIELGLPKPLSLEEKKVLVEEITELLKKELPPEYELIENK